MKYVLSFALTIVLVSPATARDWTEYLCKFTMECVENEGCEEVQGEMTLMEDLSTGHVRTDLNGAFFAVVSDQPDDDALGYDVAYSSYAGLRSWFGQKQGRFQMLSIFADGTARQTTHYGHTSIVSVGTCEKVE